MATSSSEFSERNLESLESLFSRYFSINIDKMGLPISGFIVATPLPLIPLYGGASPAISNPQRLLFSKYFTSLEFFFVAQYILPWSIVYQSETTLGYPTLEMQARRMGILFCRKMSSSVWLANLCNCVYSNICNSFLDIN